MYSEDIGPQIPGQQQPQLPLSQQQHAYPPPTAFSAPQYYTPEQQEQQQFTNQIPGMYNGGIPPSNAPPTTAPPMSISPAVRKLEDAETNAEKKPRLEEPEWQPPQDVSNLKKKP